MHNTLIDIVRALAPIFLVLPAATAAPQVSPSKNATCRYLPGDAAWPGDQDWSSLNRTVGGKLIKGVPIAQPCFGVTLNDVECAHIKNTWTTWDLFTPDPVNIMSPLFLNDSCNPFDGPDGTCTLGDMASYAIEVTDADSAAAGIKFAQSHNIRLTIKNTGHDYLGRSAGTGSLGLWTHNLKSITLLNYTSPGYTGPAVRLGAGVQFAEAYKAASDNGFRVVGGGCPTVGAAGGYPQGGGHGLLGAKYGLGSDQTLEFDVVTAEGNHLTATPTENPDLYWALSGGGAGTYAVAISVTVKAHQDGQVAGSRLMFNNDSTDAYWSAVSEWLKYMLVLDDIPGLTTFWSLTGLSFTLIDVVLPDGSVDDLSALLAPFYQQLQNLRIVPVLNETRVDPTFNDHFQYFLGANTYDTNVSISGRLVQRDVVRNNLSDLVSTFRDIVTNPNTPSEISVIGSNVTHARVGNSPDSNSVLPAWRDSLFTMTIGMGFPITDSPAQLAAGEVQLNIWQDLMRDLTPGGGAYMNEATYDNVNWKDDYYGVNYDRLRQIKAKYDPKALLWGKANVGNDDSWALADDGRLCCVNT